MTADRATWIAFAAFLKKSRRHVDLFYNSNARGYTARLLDEHGRLDVRVHGFAANPVAALNDLARNVLLLAGDSE
jgi:hypothetical protein